jgi:hypothetical protein
MTQRLANIHPLNELQKVKTQHTIVLKSILS